MAPCKDCQKTLVKYLPWILMIFIGWNSYITDNVYANGKEDAVAHQKVERLSEDMKKVSTSLESQSTEFNELSKQIVKLIERAK